MKLSVVLSDSDPNTPATITWSIQAGPMIGSNQTLDAQFSQSTGTHNTVRFPANGSWIVQALASDSSGAKASLPITIDVECPEPFTLEGNIRDSGELSIGVPCRLYWQGLDQIPLSTMESDSEGCFSFCELIGDPSEFQVRVLP